MNPIQQAIEQATAARDWLPTICGELSGLDVPEDDANMRAAIAGLERVEGKIDAALTSLRSLNKEVEEAVVSVCRAVAELPDRNSPADWPEAMLVTHDELADAVRTAVAAALGRGAVPQEDEGRVVVTWNHDRTRILAVTRQNAEWQILKVIAEAPAQPTQAETASEADYAFDDLNLRLIEVTEERDHLRAALPAPPALSTEGGDQ